MIQLMMPMNVPPSQGMWKKQTGYPPRIAYRAERRQGRERGRALRQPIGLTARKARKGKLGGACSFPWSSIDSGADAIGSPSLHRLHRCLYRCFHVADLFDIPTLYQIAKLEMCRSWRRFRVSERS
jgi:hypothetical protein